MNEREKAIEAAWQKYHRHWKLEPNTTTWQKARHAFTEGFTAAVFAWVSVEDGKEPHGPVWITDKYGNVELAYLAHGTKKWYTRDSSDDLITGVIAYMPIDEPEPYTPTNGGTDDER